VTMNRGLVLENWLHCKPNTDHVHAKVYVYNWYGYKW